MAKTREAQARSNAHALFMSLMDQSLTHLRVGQGRNDGTRITLLGHAKDLHGPHGVCTCCPREEDRRD